MTDYVITRHFLVLLLYLVAQVLNGSDYKAPLFCGAYTALTWSRLKCPQVWIYPPMGGSPMFRLFAEVNRLNNYAVILLGF